MIKAQCRSGREKLCSVQWNIHQRLCNPQNCLNSSENIRWGISQIKSCLIKMSREGFMTQNWTQINSWLHTWKKTPSCYAINVAEVAINMNDFVFLVCTLVVAMVRKAPKMCLLGGNFSRGHNLGCKRLLEYPARLEPVVQHWKPLILPADTTLGPISSCLFS